MGAPCSQPTDGASVEGLGPQETEQAVRLEKWKAVRWAAKVSKGTHHGV